MTKFVDQFHPQQPEVELARAWYLWPLPLRQALASLRRVPLGALQWMMRMRIGVLQCARNPTLLVPLRPRLVELLRRHHLQTRGLEVWEMLMRALPMLQPASRRGACPILILRLQQLLPKRWHVQGPRNLMGLAAVVWVRRPVMVTCRRVMAPFRAWAQSRLPQASLRPKLWSSPKLSQARSDLACVVFDLFLLRAARSWCAWAPVLCKRWTTSDESRRNVPPRSVPLRRLAASVAAEARLGVRIQAPTAPVTDLGETGKTAVSLSVTVVWVGAFGVPASVALATVVRVRMGSEMTAAGM